MKKGDWFEVSSDEPCDACGKPDYCYRAKDGNVIACKRSEIVTGPHNSEFEFSHTSDNGNGVWKRKGAFQQRSDNCRAPTVLPSRKPELATPEILDKVYTAFLNALYLEHKHWKHIEKNGMACDVAKQLLYRTLGPTRLEAVAKVIDAGLEQHLYSVPGFYVKDKGGYWSFHGKNGYLIPVRDREGLIIALLVRADECSDPKYRYTYISNKKDGGVSPGSPIHHPLRNENVDTTAVILTEGMRKADTIYNRMGVYALGAPGVGSYERLVKAAMDIGAKEVIFAYDADWRNES